MRQAVSDVLLSMKAGITEMVLFIYLFLAIFRYLLRLAEVLPLCFI